MYLLSGGFLFIIFCTLIIDNIFKNFISFLKYLDTNTKELQAFFRMYLNLYLNTAAFTQTNL